MPKVTKAEHSIYECLLGFCFNNIFLAPPQILAASTVSSAQFQKRKMMGDGFTSGYYCCGLFEQ